MHPVVTILMRATNTGILHNLNFLFATTSSLDWKTTLQTLQWFFVIFLTFSVCFVFATFLAGKPTIGFSILVVTIAHSTPAQSTNKLLCLDDDLLNFITRYYLIKNKTFKYITLMCPQLSRKLCSSASSFGFPYL